MSDRVTLFEVGPRDGLQSLSRLVPAETKIALVDALSRSGLSRIEVASFVSPRWVPQMADGAEVMAGIARRPGTLYAALTPNLRGLEAAAAAGCGEVAVFASASEGFSRANLNCPVEDSFARFAPVMARAAELGLPVRGYLSAAIACPYDGPVAPATVLSWARRLLEIGCYQVAVSDTIGAGTPETMGQLLDVLLAELPVGRLAGHFHDTQGQAGALVALCLERGLRSFDGSVGGLGGCPYAPGAPGNVDSRKVLEIAAAAGLVHGVDLEALAEAERIAARIAA